MMLVFILSAFAIAQAGVLKDTDCDGIYVRGVYHEQEVLKADIDRPFLLTVDYTKNTVYFSYSIDPEEDIFKTARLNINTKEYNEIDSVNNGFAQTIDPQTHEVYIGGSDGIYKYDRNSNTAEFLGAEDVNIWHIYYNKVLYYSAFPDQILYTFIDGTSTKLKDLEDTKVDLFVIDNEGEMFFTNKSGLYGLKKGTQRAVLYDAFNSGEARALTTDINGDVYVCFQDGIYSAKKETPSIEKVVDIEDGFGVSFDNRNNIIFADATRLVRLKPNNGKKCQLQ